jgi:hypothetical protein
MSKVCNRLPVRPPDTAILEFTAILGAGQQRSHVQGVEGLVAQAQGHVAFHEPASQAFHDGGLAHAGAADQHGIVFRAAREDLHHAPDLLVATDHRVDASVPRLGAEIARIAVQGRQLAVAGSVFLFAAIGLIRAQVLQGGQDLFLADVEGLQQAARASARYGDRQQQFACAHHAALAGARLRFQHHLLQVTTGRGDFALGHGGHRRQFTAHGLENQVFVDFKAAQHPIHDSRFLQQGIQDVQRLQLCVFQTISLVLGLLYYFGRVRSPVFHDSYLRASDCINRAGFQLGGQIL